MTDPTDSAEVRALREAILALPTWDKRTVPGGFHVNRAAVLALIDALAAAPREANEPHTWNAAISAAMEAVNKVASLSAAARGDALLALLSLRYVGASDAVSVDGLDVQLLEEAMLRAGAASAYGEPTAADIAAEYERLRSGTSGQPE